MPGVLNLYPASQGECANRARLCPDCYTGLHFQEEDGSGRKKLKLRKAPENELRFLLRRPQGVEMDEEVTRRNKNLVGLNPPDDLLFAIWPGLAQCFAGFAGE